MLDLSTIKVVQKDWGTQVWLNDYELLLVMRAGTGTSFHIHKYHRTYLKVLQGSIDVVNVGNSIDACDDNIVVDVGVMHQIYAKTNCVVYEKYVLKEIPRPEQDIERLSC